MVIRIYQQGYAVFRPPRCRFFPTCSEYAIQALQEWGVIRGLFLSIYRILRCNPFSKGGIDNVPIKRIKKNESGRAKHRKI